ncbi:MAG TPA: methyltransferase domain-containing protein [Polyangiaceae bacterium]|nr:methyltransferase domain-containing protein [Polyangiaceae bacterium]
MRIIAVGESQRPPPVQADHSADPTAYPAALGTRRSSRPAPSAAAAEPPAPTARFDSAPEIEDVAELPPSAQAAPLGPPSDDVTEELSDEDVSPDSGERKSSPSPDAEELGRDDAISVPPEELAALQAAQAQAKTDAKPPPPPKRAAGAPASVPAMEVAVAVSPAPTSVAPPTPDPAAAKAAQRAKTRQPWWEDLFNEDFMRASAKVNDEQVRREVTFIEDSLGVAAGGVVLDLGCGAGHHAVEFASRGYGVVGYDLSLYQLALAADVAQERSQKINFLQGDMREMAFEEMFDGVFCWNTTFGYFEEDKNLAVAQRVFKALRPGGMFLIDVLNRDFAAASSPQQVWYEGDSCVCMDDMSVDYISSRLRVKRSIILDDGRTKESLFSLRLYSLHELGKLLHEVGFRVTEASGHPATPGVFFGPNSPRIIMLAQRP